MTEAQISQIINLVSKGWSQRRIAARLGVSRWTIIMTMQANGIPAAYARDADDGEQASYPDQCAAELAALQREFPGGRYPETDGPDDDWHIGIVRRDRKPVRVAKKTPPHIKKRWRHDGRTRVTITLARVTCLEAA